MNDLNSIGTQQPALPEANKSSTVTMLTTTLLLIAGLLLASTMLTHYLLPHEITQEQISTPLSSIQLFSSAATPRPEPRTKEQTGNSLLSAPWPRMKLAGFGRSDEESGNFAIINGKKVHLGQYAAGKAKLVEIRDYDVIVEYKGETRILTIEN